MKTAESSEDWLMERFIGVAVALVALGGLSIYHGGKQLWLAAGSSATPQEVALADLLERGIQGNRYVRVKNFHIGEQYVEVGRKNAVIKDAYLVIWPAGRERPAGRVAVVKTYAISAQFTSEGSPIEGMVTGESLNDLARQKLAAEYGAAISGEVLVIEQGRKPAPSREGCGFIGLGVALMLPLAGIFGYAWWKDRNERRAAAGLTRLSKSQTPEDEAPVPQAVHPDSFQPPAPTRRGPSTLSAAAMLPRVQALRAADAQWGAIWSQLNPAGEPDVQQLLIEIRGPHMFAPHLGLGVIEEACERVLASSPEGDALAVLREATRRAEPFVR
jgi:hypothetical protein